MKSWEGAPKEREGVDFVDGYAGAEGDVLFGWVRLVGNHPCVHICVYTALVTVEMVCSPERTQTSLPFFTSLRPSSEVGERLSVVDVRDVEQSLCENWDVGNGI